MNNTDRQIKASNLAVWLLSQGISSITTDEIATLLCIPKNQVPQRLASQQKKGTIILLAKGLWAPVPPEYLTWGAPPAIDIIEPIMRHSSTDYYVGWLSAAALYGASHNAPQVFQVAVSRAHRAKIIGRSRFQFYHREHITNVAIKKFESKNGIIPVSSRETTILDIANDIGIVGGIDNVANLIIELCEITPDLKVLSNIEKYYPTSAIRRLGFIIEQFATMPELVKLLKTVCEERDTSISLLDPLTKNTGYISKTWGLKINREVNPDV